MAKARMKLTLNTDEDDDDNETSEQTMPQLEVVGDAPDGGADSIETRDETKEADDELNERASPEEEKDHDISGD